MILISKLFKRSEKRSATSGANRTRKDIFDFFHVDLKSIPDDTFLVSRLRYNNEKQIVKKFRKKLPYRECNIFDYVEVEEIGGRHKRITFKCFSPEKVRIKDLKCFTNDLALIYGKDSVGREHFTKQDRTEFKSHSYFDNFGRIWLDYNKYSHPIIISRDKNELSLKIWSSE